MLPQVNKVEEKDTHFMVHPKAGAPFRVAKAGLRPETHGILKYMAGGGDIEYAPQPIEEIEAQQAKEKKRTPVKLANPGVGEARPATEQDARDARLARARAGIVEHAPMARGGEVRRMADGGTPDAGTPDAAVAAAIAQADEQPGYAWPVSGQSPMSGGGSDTPALPLAAARKVVAPVPPTTLRPVPQPNQPTVPPPAATAPRGTGIGSPAPYLKAMQEGNEEEQQQLGYAANETEKQGEDKAQLFNRQAEQEMAAEETRAKAAEASQTAIAAQHAKLTKLVTDYSSAAVDPHKWWASRSTGDKILAAIGLALGSFSQDGTNKSVGIIENAIQKDIDAQKFNIDKLGKGVEQQRYLIQGMREQYQDKALSDAAARMAMRQTAEDRMNAMLAKTQSPIDAAKLRATIGANQANQAKDAGLFQLHFQSAASTAAHERVMEQIEQRKSELMGGGALAQQLNSDRAVDAAVHEYAESALSPASILPEVGQKIPLAGRLVPSSEAQQRKVGAETALFNAMGRRYNPESFAQFQQMFPGVFSRLTRAGDNPQERAAFEKELADRVKAIRDAKPRGTEKLAETYE